LVAKVEEIKNIKLSEARKKSKHQQEGNTFKEFISNTLEKLDSANQKGKIERKKSQY